VNVMALQAVGDAWPAGMLVAVVLFGLAIGSFLNVVIVRVPEGRSLWHPRSACPGCSAQLAWHDNIPVLSFLWLRGRCRKCGMRISMRYPIVEGVTAAALAAAYLALGPTGDFIVAAVLLATLVVVTAIDLQHQLIPDVITLPGILVGLVANLAIGHVSWLDCVIGIVVGGGLFLVIILVSRGGMGGGDMKLGAMLGAFLGWKALLFALFAAIVLGGLVGVAVLVSGLRGRKDPIPFGPFLAAGGAMALFWGERIIDRWLSGFSM
jgi:leader peptidase (prepilin peptidase) / N-methyltransferase